MSVFDRICWAIGFIVLLTSGSGAVLVLAGVFRLKLKAKWSDE